MSNDQVPGPSPQSDGQHTFKSGLRWGLAGLIATPLVWVLVMLAINSSNPNCGKPGDSGGCEMALIVGAIYSALPGAAFAFIAGAMHAARKRRAS